MSSRWRMSIALLGVLGLLASCARLPVEDEGRRGRRPAGSPGAVAVEALGDSVSLPSEWGDLVAVSHFGTYPATHLWLQAEDGTIRQVTYDHAGAVFFSLALVFRRHGGDENDAQTGQPDQ